MSFVTQEDIKFLVQEMLVSSWPPGGASVKVPFDRMSYHEAIDTYGTDKPDTRFNMKVIKQSETGLPQYLFRFLLCPKLK